MLKNISQWSHKTCHNQRFVSEYLALITLSNKAVSVNLTLETFNNYDSV